MAGNIFGRILRLSTFGESHGAAIGGTLEGVPPGIPINIELIQLALDARKPGNTNVSSPRKESDTIEILSGLFEGKTIGTPIGFILKNENQRSNDYSKLKEVYRPSHADYTYEKKYGHRDHRGGGRSSARETAVRVAAGAIAAQLIPKVKIQAWVHQAGSLSAENSVSAINPTFSKSNPYHWPEEKSLGQLTDFLQSVKEKGDTLGGIIGCQIHGVPPGWGEPVFDKLHAQLGKAMLSINAVKGFDFGGGFENLHLTGADQNDVFESDFTTKTNFSGGIQGGISNGMPIYFRVAFKPIASIQKAQNLIDKEGNISNDIIGGRHDTFVLPRAVPIVEAMAQLVLADFYLMQKINTSHD